MFGGPARMFFRAPLWLSTSLHPLATARLPVAFDVAVLLLLLLLLLLSLMMMIIIITRVCSR